MPTVVRPVRRIFSRTSRVEARRIADILRKEGGSDRADHIKIAVLLGSVAAAAVAGILLRFRSRTYRRIEEEASDDDELI